MIGNAGFHTVSDPLQAKLLTDGKIQTYFRPFLATDATASEVAAELGADLNTVLYRIKTFLAAGLLQVVREVPRHGRAIKVYRSVHDAYFIPYEVTPFASLEERLLQHLTLDVRERVRVQAKRMTERGWYGQRLYRNERGEVWSDAARDANSELDWLSREWSSSIDFWTDVLLTDDEARELQALLYETLKRTEGRSKASRRTARKVQRPDHPSASSDAPVETTEPAERLREYRLSVALLPLDE